MQRRIKTSTGKCMRCGEKAESSIYDSWLCTDCAFAVWGRVAIVAEWMGIVGWRPR